MASCTGIFTGSDFDCNDPLIAGVFEDLILMNLLDIDSLTFSITDPSIIEGITLKNGKSAFEFQGTRQSLVPQEDFIPGRFSVGYDHQLAFQVFQILQRQKDNLEALALKKTVGLVKNKGGGWEVYGIIQGLELLTNSRLPGDQDTGGSFSVVVKTSENTAREPKHPQDFFITDEATTDAAVEALLNQPAIDNITPTTGSIAGGDAYTITGSNFEIGSPLVANVSSLDWIDTILSLTNQAAFTIDSPTQITIASSVALSADLYKIRATAPNASSGDSARVVQIS